MRHTLRETRNGLRRNVSMTIAVIVTMWVSLSLFGAALLAAQQVDLIKGKWYDKVEVSVFLCVKNVPGDNCVPGKDASQADKDAIKAALQSDPQVEKVYYESKKDAFEEYQRVYKDSPVKEILTVDTIQDSFRVKLVNPENYREVVAATQTMKGVQAVVDLHTALDPLFVWLNSLRWTTVGLSALLLVAAALQITNTIRMAVFARRRELEIMKLVGASNRFILTPFLLESLVAGVIGAILAAGTLAAGTYVIVMKKFAVTMSTIAWVNWHHVWVAIGWLAIVAVVLSLIPSYAAAKKYLKV